MSDFLIATIIMYIIVNFIVFLASPYILKLQKYYGSPKYIYENSRLNIVGVFFSSVLCFMLFPLYYICMFIYWIFHIGRK